MTRAATAQGGAARLDEFDADEWYDICRKIKPDLTREEHDKMWTEFQANKAAGLFKREIQ